MLANATWYLCAQKQFMALCLFYIRTSLQYPSFFFLCGIIIASTVVTRLLLPGFAINYIHAIINFTFLKYSTRVCDIVTRTKYHANKNISAHVHKLNLMFSSLGSTLQGERWESLVPFVRFSIWSNPIGPKPAQDRWVGSHLSGQRMLCAYADVSKISSCNHATVNLSDLEVCHHKCFCWIWKYACTNIMVFVPVFFS